MVGLLYASFGCLCVNGNTAQDGNRRKAHLHPVWVDRKGPEATGAGNANAKERSGGNNLGDGIESTPFLFQGKETKRQWMLKQLSRILAALLLSLSPFLGGGSGAGRKGNEIWQSIDVDYWNQ